LIFPVAARDTAASTFGDLFADVPAQRFDRGDESAGAGRGRSHHVAALTFDEAMRGGPARRDGHAAGTLPHVPRPGAAAGAWSALRPMRGHRHREVCARPHGLFQSRVPAVRAPACKRTRAVRYAAAARSRCAAEALTIESPQESADGAENSRGRQRARRQRMAESTGISCSPYV
jgi:hypothetical protein